ncbi:retrovirus-related pol polyprotein from transposon TNT 1-94 [Tanacetum coccineum]
MTKISDEHAMVCYINKQRRTNHKDYQNCLFACFLSQMEPKKVIQALEDPSWIEAMQEELLQFQLQKVWTLVDLPNGKRAIGTKWAFRNKKDERGIVVINKARLMDVKSAFLYGTIDEEVYVCQPPGFKDLHFPDKVYKVEKALYGLHQAPRAWYETLSTYLIENGFRRGTIDKTLFIKKDKGDILLVQVYVDDIIFGSTKKSLCDEFKGLMHKRFQMSSMGELTFFLGLQTTSTPMEPNKALVKDEEADSVDVHLYRSMIGSLMYLIASRPDIMFAVCACARDSPFDLEAFLDSDYARASLDRKSTTGGCQFLGKRLISWQCKKQTIVANSTTEAEYDVAVNCYGQNPVFHSKTKHIEIRHHFIKDCYEKKLIQTELILLDTLSTARLSLYCWMKLYTKVDAARPNLKFVDQHNMVACLEKTEENEWGGQYATNGIDGTLYKTVCIEGSEDFHQIIDFLTISHIKYALTENPTIYTSLIQQFWETASASTSENEEMELIATIDGRVKAITQASIRRHLKLEDADGIDSLPNTEIFEQLALMGPKKIAWEQFSSNIATVIICLATNRTFNFSKMIFEGMLKNLNSRSKFLMYPRFIQIFLNKHKRHLLPHKRTYVAPTLTQKLFSNMRRVSKGYTRGDIPLFLTMLTAPESSPSRITSSPSLSPQTHPSTSQQPSTPPFMQTIHDAEEPASMTMIISPRFITGSDEGSLTLNELMVLCTTLSKKVENLQNDLKQTKLTYGAAYTKLILKVKKLEHKVKASKSRRRARVIISKDDDDLEDSSKQGRIIAEIDQNPSISLVQDEGTSWIQEDAEIWTRTSADTEILLDQEEPTELVEDFGSGEKGEKEISTANISVSTASEIPKVSTASVSTIEAVLSTVILETAVVTAVTTADAIDKGQNTNAGVLKGIGPMRKNLDGHFTCQRVLDTECPPLP